MVRDKNVEVSKGGEGEKDGVRDTGGREGERERNREDMREKQGERDKGERKCGKGCEAIVQVKSTATR